MAEGKARMVRQAASSIILPRVSTPLVNPPTGFDELFMGTDGCLKSLRPDGSVRDYCAGGGVVSGLLPNRRFAIITPDGQGPSNPTIIAIGDSAQFGSTGNYGYVGPTATEFGLLELHTGPSGNVNAYLETRATSSNPMVYVGGSSFYFDAYCLLSCPDTADVRLWWGFVPGGAVSHLGSDDPDNPYVGFRFSTNVPDTNWQFMSHGAAAGGSSQVDTGQVPSSSTKWFSMHYDPVAATLTGKIDGSQVGQITTKFPNAALNWMFGIRNLTAADKHFRFGQLLWITYK